nr:GDP-mannose 4,6-dehydratase [Anaerolineae bacterium]
MNTPLLTNNIINRPVLVTGGAGFIGSHLVEALLSGGTQVIVLDSLSDFYSPEQKRANIAPFMAHPSFTFIHGDIRDRDLVFGIFRDYRPARVAHLAAMANVRYSIERASEYVDVNITGTINLLDAARETPTTNFIFASTSSIYGNTDQIPFSEDQDTSRPLAPYPASKKASEVMGYAYHNLFGLDFTALRFFTAYGPGVRPDMMSYMVMEKIVKGEPITLYNGGEMFRDWTYIEDIVKGIVSALDLPLGYDIINLGRGEPVKLSDFVAIIESLVGRKAIVHARPAPPSEPPITYCNLQKARDLLGYQPAISIEEGLTRTWNWVKNRGFGSPST